MSLSTLPGTQQCSVNLSCFLLTSNHFSFNPFSCLHCFFLFNFSCIVLYLGEIFITNGSYLMCKNVAYALLFRNSMTVCAEVHFLDHSNSSTFRKRRSWHLVPSLHGKQMGKQCQPLFLGAPKSLKMVNAAMKLKDAYSLEEKL